MFVELIKVISSLHFFCIGLVTAIVVANNFKEQKLISNYQAYNLGKIIQGLILVCQFLSISYDLFMNQLEN